MTDTQDDLFSYLHRSTDPSTSADAARSISQRQSQSLVLEALRAIGPATDERLCEHLADKPISPSRARTARCEITRMGLVVEAGQGRTRSGRRALLWAVA